MASLDQWETRLRPYFTRSLRIIAEIPLERADIEDMAARVSESISRQGFTPATRFLWDRYPLTILALMAGFAAHNTEQNYWAAFGQFIGVEIANHFFNQGWHHKFIEKAQSRNLRTFDWDEASLRYVATIRFHGGIPAYSLPDFFERILLPTVERPALREVEPGKALETVLRTAYFVDSPVINFLQNSGKLGVELFANCQKLARHYLNSHGDLLAADEMDLPVYLVDAFAEFMESKTEQLLHLRKPQVLLAADARDGYLWLKLPEQQIALRYASGAIEWRIQTEPLAAVRHEPVSMLRHRQDTLLKEILLPLEAAPSSVHIQLVSLGVDDTFSEIMRSWKIQILPGSADAPIFAFFADGKMANPRAGLPSEVLTVIFPFDSQLSVDGPHQIMDDYGRMEPPWQQWQMQVIDLASAWSMHVSRNGTMVGGPVSVKGKYPTPELVGGTIPGFAESVLYIGEPPILKIPLRDSARAQNDLSRWRITLVSKWAAWPEARIDSHAAAYGSQITIEDGSALLPLKALLGSSPVGTYSLHLSGPGDVEADFPFRIWPKLLLLGMPKPGSIHGGANERVKFSLLLPDEANCEPQSGSGDVKVAVNGVAWEVTAGPEVVRTELNLTLTAPNGSVIRVPISVPIPRLRRAVTFDNDLSKLSWSTRIIQKSADAYLQSDNSALHIEMFGLSRVANRAEVQLVSFTDENEVLQSEKLKPTPFSKNWFRTSLNFFRDTFNHASQQGRFDFFLPALDDQPEIRIPLAVFNRQFTVKDLSLEQVEPLRWRITWTEQTLLRNRRVMIVSAWQPWQMPLEYRIPDDAQGEFFIEGISLPKQRYHLYFYIVPTWYPEQTKPPDGAQPILIDLLSPDERLEALKIKAEDDEDNFKNMFETACIFESLGRSEVSDLAVSKMTIVFKTVTNLRLILSFLEWLMDRDQKSPYTRFFTNSAFTKKRVEAVLQLYPPDHPHVRLYFGMVPNVHLIDRDSAFLIAERSEDPVVINACLNHLLNRKDEILILLILDMIKKARLSNQDAIDVFAQKPEWSLKLLASENPDPDTDRIIAGLLPRCGNTEDTLDIPLQSLIKRAIPYIQDDSYRNVCISRILSEDEGEGIRLIFSLLEKGNLSEETGRQLIARSPETAIEFLKSLEKTNFTRQWIDILAKDHPQLAGVLRPNVKLQTPIGNVLIDYLEGMDGLRITEAKLLDQNCRANVLLGEGRERARAWLDIHEGTITFMDCDKMVGCGHCGFMHPEQDVVSKHIKKVHGGRMVFRNMPATQEIDIDQIKLLPS